jgi:hypothetical protein
MREVSVLNTCRLLICCILNLIWAWIQYFLLSSKHYCLDLNFGRLGSSQVQNFTFWWKDGVLSEFYLLVDVLAVSRGNILILHLESWRGWQNSSSGRAPCLASMSKALSSTQVTPKKVEKYSYLSRSLLVLHKRTCNYL